MGKNVSQKLIDSHLINDLIKLLKRKANAGTITLIYAARDEEHNGGTGFEAIPSKRVTGIAANAPGSIRQDVYARARRRGRAVCAGATPGAGIPRAKGADHRLLDLSSLVIQMDSPGEM